MLGSFRSLCSLVSGVSGLTLIRKTSGVTEWFPDANDYAVLICSSPVLLSAKTPTGMAPYLVSKTGAGAFSYSLLLEEERLTGFEGVESVSSRQQQRNRNRAEVSSLVPTRPVVEQSDASARQRRQDFVGVGYPLAGVVPTRQRARIRTWAQRAPRTSPTPTMMVRTGCRRTINDSDIESSGSLL